LYKFQIGDFIVEQPPDAREGIGLSFGVITDVHSTGVITVQFPEGKLYTFADHCQPYQEWLNAII